MLFEYDDKKSEQNGKKHGIHFEEAQALWEDARRLVTPARPTNELRYRVVGRIAGTHWTAIVTYRADTIRIISVRYSRKEEKEAYEKKADAHSTRT